MFADNPGCSGGSLTFLIPAQRTYARIAKRIDRVGDTAPARDLLFEAYRVAKARHDEAIRALKGSPEGWDTLDPELIRRQVEAAREEIAALDALDGLR